MMKKAKFLAFLVLGAGRTLIAAGRSDAGEPKAVDKSKWPQRMTLAAGPTGSFSYTMGSPWASNIGTILGVFSPPNQRPDCRSTPSWSTTSRPRSAYAAPIWPTIPGGRRVEPGKKLEIVRAMAVFDSNVIQFFTNRSSGITNFRP